VLDGRFRRGVDSCVRPVGVALVRTGVSPDAITAAGLALSVPTAWAVASGHLLVGLALLVFTAVPDLLDGALAKAAGRTSVRGAFFDSVSDRVSDSLVLGGLAWYLQDRYGGHAFALPLAVLGASLLISYERAKAESLGFEAKGGLMERAERIVVLCAGLAFSSILVPLLWAMLGATLLTAGQRFVKVWRQASVARPAPSRRPAPSAERPASDGARPRLAWLDGTERRWSAGERLRWPAGERRYTGSMHRDGAASRWQERRLARRSRRAETPESVTALGRWRGSRRP
jgi:CDP-diacylglycerol--glycerol-3-phosphate 3-phosphatidyltransferase